MALKDDLEKLKNLDLNDINWDRIGVWPLAARVALCIAVLAVIMFASYFLSVKKLNVRLETVQQSEQILKNQFED